MLRKLKALFFTNATVSQTVAKNAFWLAVSNIGGRLIRAIVIIYAARILGTSEWGVFSYTISLAALLTIFGDFGLGPLLTRETAKSSTTKRRLQTISTVLSIKLVIVTATALFIIVVGPHFATIEKAKALLPLVALITVFDGLREFGFSLTKAIEKMEWEAGLFLLTNIAISGFGLLFLTLAPNVVSFTWAYVVGTAIGAGATFLVLKKRFKRLLSNFTKTLIVPIFRAAWPFAVAGLLGAVMINTDILIIGWLQSAKEVGLYSAGQRIIQLLYILPAIMAGSTFPLLSRLAQQDRDKFRRILERVIALLLLVAAPMAIGGFISGAGVIGLIFGTEYLPATHAFQILLLTLLVNFPAVILSNAIFAYDRQRALITYSAIGVIANVFLNILLIPLFGILGAAWATLLTQIVSNLYLWRTLKRINPFRVLPYLKRVVAGTAVMGVVTALLVSLGLNVLITIAVAGTTYFGFLYLVKEPLFQEARLILASAKDH